ncbi:arrestin domain-containing protein 3-like [Sycon ciliatum]|uniref:arrestin domain-containing protein 3-like n=1 Tax=Sycon ciliatum TaxID=27933 RepID=UPI0020AAF110|eukprot:scpid88249/ scgid31757/ Arrestin domain-containing protein 3
MGGIRRVKLVFQNVTQMVFCDGQALTAVVEVEVTEPTRVRKVSVNIDGSAHCRWKSGNTTYRGNMAYLSECVVVWQPTVPNEMLTVGVHHWSFTFRLPRGLPSSCNIGCGGVSYEAAAVVDIPWGFDVAHRIPFGVVKRIEVNTTQLRRSITKAAEKTLCCCCCSQGPVKLRATINKLGFCNGDSIDLKFSAENNTDRELGTLRVRLLREEIAKVRNNTNSRTRTCHVATTQEVLGAQSNINVNSFKIPVRDLPPSVAAQVVFVKYTVEVAIVVPWGMNCVCRFDVVIGTMDSSDEDRQNVEELVGTLLREAGRRAHIQSAARNEGLEEVHEPPPAYTDAVTSNSETQRLVSAMYD